MILYYIITNSNSIFEFPTPWRTSAGVNRPVYAFYRIVDRRVRTRCLPRDHSCYAVSQSQITTEHLKRRAPFRAAVWRVNNTNTR